MMQHLLYTSKFARSYERNFPACWQPIWPSTFLLMPLQQFPLKCTYSNKYLTTAIPPQLNMSGSLVMVLKLNQLL